MWKRLKHWLAHRTHMNHGVVETWYTKTDTPRLMVGFRCNGCGKLLSQAPAVTWHYPKARS